MGLDNNSILSGHLGVTVHWSDSRQAVPVKRRIMTGLQPTWIDEVFTRRAAIGAPDIQYTDMMKKRIPVVTPSTEAAKKVNKNAYSNIVAPNDYAAKVWKALVDAGFPGSSINFVYAMCYMESGHWSNGPARKDNNPGNIMWYKGKTKGTYIPANGTYAIHFKNLNQFADELYKTLSKGANPLGATTLEEYVSRLAANHYFGDGDATAYLESMRTAMDDLDQANTKYMDQWRDKQIKQRGLDPGNSTGIIAWMKAHPIWTGVIAATGGILVIKTITRR